MSVIKINAITVPADSGDELAKRFAARGDAIKDTPGFEGYELLQPTDGRNVWLVITRWESDEAFEAWKASREFAKSHAEGKDKAAEEKPAQKPVGTGAELWEYTVAVSV
ncbi:antibiotic biosynthesis monooxygenase family protein [Micrococcoides hystricis]|uniref:Antibiotic biosynthesis monooxygenase family protein n=1 Tax=Micrococcoides hystricis TaxID=1572761 RepID=A0ABV6PCQ7_9MICC